MKHIKYKSLIISSLVCILPVFFGIALWNKLPESIPIHFDIYNNPDNFAPETPMSTRLKKLKSDPYFNALQIKYAYAVTCHKAQGGQWKNVFIDMGYIAPEAQGMDFYRWLYTAITRATDRLYLINPSVEVK